MDTSRLVDAESCNSWTEAAAKSPTVSMARLAVPGKASGEFQKACGNLKGRRLPDAETHARKAVQIYPDYPAAWVLLGQVLEAEDKKVDARSACSHALGVDPDYVASYLCLAAFAAGDNDWDQVTRLSDQALALDPLSDPYALYYAADAGFHHHQLVQAEMKARNAVQLDTWHRMPELHMLLANIYQAEGDAHNEAAQLREFLKYAPNSKDAPAVKTALAQLSPQPAK
ncbi:MAG TPA: hypothetical protein VJO53_13120 [Candidatus Acidoferrales bacterium]|nr:hypothetical protein [Candidatus Acidoferrales bacterium]